MAITNINPGNLLTDTGPIVAQYLDNDQHYEKTKLHLPRLTLNSVLITTWPCLTETFHILKSRRRPDLNVRLIAKIQRGELQVHNPTPQELEQTLQIITDYGPKTDLADASLIAAAETLKLKTIFTFDSDFRKYILADGSAFTILPEDLNQ